jgi:hypothetical protein
MPRRLEFERPPRTPPPAAANFVWNVEGFIFVTKLAGTWSDGACPKTTTGRARSRIAARAAKRITIREQCERSE